MNSIISRVKQERKKDFKKGIVADEARRKREENYIEIRKSKREDNFQKKRNIINTVNINFFI